MEVSVFCDALAGKSIYRDIEMTEILRQTFILTDKVNAEE